MPVPADQPKEAKRPSPDGSHAPGAAAAKPGQKAAIRREAIPPALAPWPPFAPSARYTLRRDWLVKDEVNWGSVADKVEAALTDNGYDDIRYYAVPGGFAVATRIERIHPDGSSYGADQRFVPRIDHVSPGNWTFESFIASLVGAPIGYYRCFLFVFSDQPFGYRSGVVTPEVLEQWRGAGWNTLGHTLRDLRYSEEMRAEVLIYQFEQARAGQSPTLASGVDAERQLQIANLLDHLRSQP